MVDESREESLPEVFWAVARKLRGLSREHLAPWDLTPSQVRALRTLIHNRDGIRLRDLAERLHIAPRSATEVVDHLESRDLAERLPDPDDRRATLVRLTEQGLKVMHAIHETQHTATEQLFGRISEADRAELIRILRQLHP